MQDTYEDTPVGVVTEQAKRDMDLIHGNVERREWASVIEGVKYQVEAFTELLEHLRTLDAKGLLDSAGVRDRSTVAADTPN